MDRLSLQPPLLVPGSFPDPLLWHTGAFQREGETGRRKQGGKGFLPCSPSPGVHTVYVRTDKAGRDRSLHAQNVLPQGRLSNVGNQHTHASLWELHLGEHLTAHRMLCLRLCWSCFYLISKLPRRGGPLPFLPPYTGTEPHLFISHRSLDMLYPSCVAGGHGREWGDETAIPNPLHLTESHGLE